MYSDTRSGLSQEPETLSERGVEEMKGTLAKSRKPGPEDPAMSSF